MKRSYYMMAVALAAIFTASSCSKEKTTQTPDPSADKVEISIKGEMGELECTKASVSNVMIMTWTDEDRVYVYGTADGLSITKLGELEAAPIAESGNRVADLSGTITAPYPGTKLSLVYSTAAPSDISEGAISVDMSSQSGAADAVSSFVAYATVTYGGTTSSTYRTAFKFATSVLRVNASGLLANLALTEATLGKIETRCKLTFAENSSPSVVGDNATGTITRTFTNCSANAKGYAAFYIAVPAITANSDRTLSVVQVENEFAAIGFETGSKTAGKMMNSIAQMKADPSNVEKNTTNSDSEDLNI